MTWEDCLKEFDYITRTHSQNSSPSERHWNKFYFDKFLKKKKIFKYFVEITDSVYRFKEFCLDVYPSTLWGKNYRTGQKYTIEQVLEILKKLEN